LTLEMGGIRKVFAAGFYEIGISPGLEAVSKQV
jgi:hypothetical protein